MSEMKTFEEVQRLADDYVTNELTPALELMKSLIATAFHEGYIQGVNDTLNDLKPPQP